jgi:hypothetical protein
MVMLITYLFGKMIADRVAAAQAHRKGSITPAAL